MLLLQDYVLIWLPPLCLQWLLWHLGWIGTNVDPNYFQRVSRELLKEGNNGGILGGELWAVTKTSLEGQRQGLWASPRWVLQYTVSIMRSIPKDPRMLPRPDRWYSLGDQHPSGLSGRMGEGWSSELPWVRRCKGLDDSSMLMLHRLRIRLLYRCEGISTRGEMGTDQAVQVQEGKQR